MSMVKSLTITNIKKIKLLVIMTSMLSTVLLSGCMKSNAATQISYQSDVEVTESMLRTVNAVFRTSFPGGAWRYQGAQAINGTINAYIQIPEKLQMSKENQISYLKMSLCPSSTKHALWNEIKGIPLSVHVYTMNKKHTVFANCTNPVS